MGTNEPNACRSFMAAKELVVCSMPRLRTVIRLAPTTTKITTTATRVRTRFHRILFPPRTTKLAKIRQLYRIKNDRPASRIKPQTPDLGKLYFDKYIII